MTSRNITVFGSHRRPGRRTDARDARRPATAHSRAGRHPQTRLRRRASAGWCRRRNRRRRPGRCRQRAARHGRRPRRLLRDQLLRALLRPRRSSPRAWRAGAAPRRTRGVQARRSGPRWKTRATFVAADGNRMPMLMGKYNVPHFDAKGEANRALHRPRGADDASLHVVLLGQPDPLRHGAEEGRRTACSPSRCRWRDKRAARASPPRTSASAPTASSSGGAANVGKTVGIAGEHLTGAQMAAALTKALGPDGAVQRGHA